MHKLKTFMYTEKYTVKMCWHSMCCIYMLQIYSVHLLIISNIKNCELFKNKIYMLQIFRFIVYRKTNIKKCAAAAGYGDALCLNKKIEN